MSVMCEGSSDDCTGIATTVRGACEYSDSERLCDACATVYDNYEPPDMDGEEMFRDYQAEARDSMDAARRLK